MTQQSKIKAVLIMHAYQEESLPYASFHVRLGRFFQDYYRCDQSVKLDIIQVPLKLYHRFRWLREVCIFTCKLFPLLPSIIRYDVIIGAHVVFTSLLGIIVTFLRKLLRRKVSLVILDPTIIRFVRPTQRILLGLFRFFFLPVDKLITFSQGEYSFWIKYLGFSNRASYIPCGIDIEFFQPSGERGDYIFSAGGTARDFPTLISAMEQIDAKLLLIAVPPAQEQLTGARLPENVDLIPPVSRIEYRDLLCKSVFVVVPLQDMPAGKSITTIVEAMAAGKAVITTKTGGGAPDYVTDGETGLLVEPGNAADLRQKIVFLLNHPEEAKRMGENARREAEARLSHRSTVEALKRILEEVHTSN